MADAANAYARISEAGHSYDLDAENMWGQIENIFRRVSRAEDVAFMTNIESVRYLESLTAQFPTTVMK